VKKKRKKRVGRKAIWTGLAARKLEPLIKDGRVMAILRPADPKAALAEARRIHRESNEGKLTSEETQDQLDQMLTAQEYRYMGIACMDGVSLLNHDYTKIVGDSMKPGDSFAPYDQVMETFDVAPKQTD